MAESQATTTIQITEATWNELTTRKGCGESFDDVIQELIDNE